jgi:hypothetical protein
MRHHDENEVSDIPESILRRGVKGAMISGPPKRVRVLPRFQVLLSLG